MWNQEYCWNNRWESGYKLKDLVPICELSNYFHRNAFCFGVVADCDFKLKKIVTKFELQYIPPRRHYGNVKTYSTLKKVCQKMVMWEYVLYIFYLNSTAARDIYTYLYSMPISPDEGY